MKTTRKMITSEKKLKRDIPNGQKFGTFSNFPCQKTTFNS